MSDARAGLASLQAANRDGDQRGALLASSALGLALKYAARAAELMPAAARDGAHREIAAIERAAGVPASPRPGDQPRIAALVTIAVRQIDGSPSYKVLLKTITVAENASILGAVARQLQSLPHPVHGTYLDALLRLVHLEGSKELRDLILRSLASAGVSPRVSAQVAKMSRAAKLYEAAARGAPDIPREMIDQLVQSLSDLPALLLLGVGASALGAGGAIHVALVAVLGADVARDLVRYYAISVDAKSESDLAAAGSFFAHAVAALGVVQILSALSRVRVRQTAERSARAAPPKPDEPRPGPPALARPASESSRNDGPRRPDIEIAEDHEAGVMSDPSPGFLASAKKNPNKRASTRDIAGKTANEEASQIGMVWAHKIAHALGGLDVPENLVAATHEANQTMLVFERMAIAIMKQGRRVHVAAEATMKEGSRVGHKLRYRVWIEADEVVRDKDGSPILTEDNVEVTRRVITKAIDATLDLQTREPVPTGRSNPFNSSFRFK